MTREVEDECGLSAPLSLQGRVRRRDPRLGDARLELRTRLEAVSADPPRHSSPGRNLALLDSQLALARMLVDPR